MSKERLIVVKIGGSVIDNPESLNHFLKHFAEIADKKILVHGGGAIATELSAELGIETMMNEGRRVTDEPTLRVVVMTYAGWINKSIVAHLQSLHCRAFGFSGADGGVIPATKRRVENVDYGFVGDIMSSDIDSNLICSFLSSGIVPVIAPISADIRGTLLNVNADTIAQSIAIAMSEQYDVTLIYCFEKNGVLSDISSAESVIAHITSGTVEDLKRDGTVSGGMIPKVDNAIAAVEAGVLRVVIGNALHFQKIVESIASTRGAANSVLSSRTLHNREIYGTEIVK